MSVEHVPFADWPALLAYVQQAWKLEALDQEGEWFERVWEWPEDDRSQLVTFAPLTYQGEVWVSWSAAVADAAAMTDAQLIEATDGEVGRIVRDEGCCWLEQHLPLALLTPRLLEHYSDSFAERADDLELSITGADRD